MKWAFLILNGLAAIALIFLGAVAVSVHRVHSYSVYREFVSVGAVDEEKLRTLPALPGTSTNSPYDMEKRIEQVGNTEFWFRTISEITACACLANGVIPFFSLPKRIAKPSDSH